MPRYLALSNGRLLVNFDRQYRLRDLYWPHVGQENHTEGDPFRFGVRCDDQFSWTDDSSWIQEICYLDDALVGETTLRHKDLGLALVCRDTVDFREDVYVRRIEVIDVGATGPQTRKIAFGSPMHASPLPIRLFFSQEFHIYGNEIGDTAYYDPDRRSVVHYKDRRWFLVGAGKKQGDRWDYGVDQWTIGQRKEGSQPAWQEAPAGNLSGRPVARGSVDSVVALDLQVPPGGRAVGAYWIAAAHDLGAVSRIDQAVRTDQPETLLERTRSYWELWVRRERIEEEDLPGKLSGLSHRSLLLVRAHLDDGGGVLAATDYDTAQPSHDTYAYVWPRDGSLAVAALITAGYSAASERFFQFCHSVITPEGYLLHKFNPSGSLASTWQGWLHEGRKVLPVQEDETALVLWALRLYFDKFHNVEFVKSLYEKLIVRAANWMMDYTDEQGLPQPSWGLWEQWRDVHAWTVGAVWAGLQAASRFADDFGHPDLTARCTQAADRLKQVVARVFWDEQDHRFVRLLSVKPGQTPTQDKTLDASTAGLWYFGMFEPTDPKIVATMEAVRRGLWVRSPVGGLARYENDSYHKVESDGNPTPGNPWFVCTLWLAQWYIRKATSEADLQPAAELLKWAASRALPSGLMAEQIHPFTDEPLSACPLTWSHSTFVVTIHQYMAKCRELQCGAKDDLQETVEPNLQFAEV